MRGGTGGGRDEREPSAADPDVPDTDAGSARRKGRRRVRTVVGSVIGSALFVTLVGVVVDKVWDEYQESHEYDPEVSAIATISGGTLYDSDDAEVRLDVRNVGDDDVKQIQLEVGSTRCPTGVDLPRGEALTGLTCDVPASQASEAGRVLVLDGSGEPVGDAELDISVRPSPCPPPFDDPREIAAPTVDEFVERWNKAVIATRGSADPDEADACADLGSEWEIEAASPSAELASGAGIGEHSRINWDVDVQDRLVSVSVFLASGGVVGDQLHRDVLRGVLGNAVASDRHQAADLSTTWSAECTGSSSIEIEDPDVLAVRFC